MAHSGTGDKKALRARMRMVRDMVDDHLMRSVDLWSQVATLPEYQAAHTVMAFVAAKGEPDTDPLFARLAADGKRLVLPRVEGSELVVVDASSPHSVSSLGISEPQGPAIDPAQVQLVIVPGLAFTPAGARLGYGGGYYDRFLTRHHNVPTVAVCFAEQLVDVLPTDAHDVQIQRVISA